VFQPLGTNVTAVCRLPHAKAITGHSDQWVSKHAVCRSTHGKSPPPPGLRGAYWPLEGPVQLVQALAGPFFARSIRPKCTHWPSCGCFMTTKRPNRVGERAGNAQGAELRLPLKRGASGARRRPTTKQRSCSCVPLGCGAHAHQAACSVK
jgi:hypothetical protein